jgi:hypothetical protein
MSRDKDEALRRLQEALLEDEEADTEAAPDEEAFPEIQPEEDTRIADAGVYQNFSNDYGKNLRNFASGYRAYNADKTDTDLDRYSETVREGKSARSFLWIPVLLLGLLAAVVLALLWKYLRLGGIL